MTSNDGRNIKKKPKHPSDPPKPFTGMDSDTFQSQEDVDELLTMYDEEKEKEKSN